MGASAKPPAVSVVVATRDRERRLAALLRSLADQTLDESQYEVVVVDDASRDGAAALLRSEADAAGYELRPVMLPTSGGPARARNIGWRAARAPLVAFTDDDCEADPRWLERCLRAAERSPGAIVQGRTAPNPAELDRIGPFSHTRDVDGSGPWWFETCNIVYPRELLERLDGFDEGFPEALGEDTDLGWRALAAGAERALAPEALVYHAVEDLGPVGHLRMALRGADGVLIFRRHPELRAGALRGGVLRNPAHGRLLLAAAGLALSRRWAPAALLAAPYAKQLAWRCRRVGASPALSPYYVLYDLLTMYTTARGDLRHRVLVI
ncbi:MAG: glycosyltransferase family 2 protein [Solirubrobacterales bacterium]